jgi:hypothetical protein
LSVFEDDRVFAPNGESCKWANLTEADACFIIARDYGISEHAACLGCRYMAPTVTHLLHEYT